MLAQCLPAGLRGERWSTERWWKQFWPVRCGWATAIVKTFPDHPFGWRSYKWIGPTCTEVGWEYTIGVTLALPNGNQTTGFATGHLSDYFYGPGDSIALACRLSRP